MPWESSAAHKPDGRPAWFDASWDPEVPLVPAEDLDPNDVPQAAVLAHLGDPAGMQALARTLGEGDDDAIRVGVDALGRLGASAAPALDALLEAADATNDGETRSRCRRAVQAIQDALGRAPSELEAASAPAGTGTEPEAAMPPEGTGTEVEAAARPRQR